MVTELPEGWTLKFNGGNPVILNENSTIVRQATWLEIYERMSSGGREYYYNNMTEEQQKQINDLFGKPGA